MREDNRALHASDVEGALNATRRRPGTNAAATLPRVRCIECGSGVSVPAAIVGGPLTCPVCSTELIVGGRRCERRRRARSDVRALLSATARPAGKRWPPSRLLRWLTALALVAVIAVVVVTDLETVIYTFEWLSRQVAEQLGEQW